MCININTRQTEQQQQQQQDTRPNKTPQTEAFRFGGSPAWCVPKWHEIVCGGGHHLHLPPGPGRGVFLRAGKKINNPKKTVAPRLPQRRRGRHGTVSQISTPTWQRVARGRFLYEIFGTRTYFEHVVFPRFTSRQYRRSFPSGDLISELGGLQVRVLRFIRLKSLWILVFCPVLIVICNYI